MLGVTVLLYKGLSESKVFQVLIHFPTSISNIASRTQVIGMIIVLELLSIPVLASLVFSLTGTINATTFDLFQLSGRSLTTVTGCQKLPILAQPL